MEAKQREESDQQAGVSCRVCGSSDCALLGVPAYRRPTNVAGVAIDVSDLALGHYRCADCRYLFVHPPIPERRLLDCYARAAHGHWATGSTVSTVRNYQRKRELLERHAPGRRILDFGCYDGGFLAYLGEGWDRSGIEPAAEAAQVAAERGVQVLGPTVESLATQTVAGFDVITAFDVVEHLNRPVETLAALSRLMNVGGVMMLETGNSDSWPWRSQQQRYPYCGLVEHVGFFNRSSVQEAARRAGLQMVWFEESVHAQTTIRQRVRGGVQNLVYRGIRAARELGVPLWERAANVALGPFPRSVQRRDHLIAVLRKPE